MKFAKTLLAVAFPLLLSAGCALDVGTSADGLTVEINADFGINICGQSTHRWLDDDSRWPVETIVAGDMVFTKGELLTYIQENPGTRSDLIAEMAATQLNMAVGLIIPTNVVDDLVAADDLVMAPDGDYGTPPPVAIDDFAALTDFNALFERDCFVNPGNVAEVTPGIRDIRPDIVVQTAAIHDVRQNIAAVD